MAIRPYAATGCTEGVKTTGATRPLEPTPRGMILGYPRIGESLTRTQSEAAPRRWSATASGSSCQPSFKSLCQMIEERIEGGVGLDRNDSLSRCGQKSDWRSRMRLKVVSVLAAIIAVAWAAQFAQAGAIRYAGRELHKGSIAAVQKTSDATGTVAGGVGDVGKATRAALKNGRVTLGKDAASGPGMAVRGTKAAASKVWKAVWWCC